ncbi:MAG: M1 family metallopeptidase, partial [Bacteroidetes bacterium]|nr:M1 family metallopeptidase [Bacteroidota bacterium]
FLFGQTSGYSGTGSNIDVTYHRCEWRINPDSASKGIKGTVTTYFVTKLANVSTISLDLNKASFNNANLSVYYHGSPVSFSFPSSGAVNILNMVLPSSLPLNSFDSITINYNGAPPAVVGQAEGYQKKASGGANYIYTLSESYEDRDWWPCKADMQDKIDSMDIYMNVPNSFTAVSLGRLIDSSLAGANQVFHWKSNLPTASYLVAVGVARYRVYDRGTVNVNGTNVPVWYFLFPGKTAATYTNILNALDKGTLELSAFSTVFGDYPFKTEKHGYYEFGWGGGMEHQSISAMGSGALTSWSTIAHELAHQWFGDKVTFGTWNHLWLAEGFARYSEALAAELVPSLGQSAAAERSGMKSTTNSITYRNYGCYIPNGSITSSDVMWSSAYGTTVYERGAMVVSMLRTLLGDTKFYQACQDYLNDPALAYRSATTDDLRLHMQNAAGGYDLTSFFNSYVTGNGYPSYNAGIGWARSGTNRITFQVTAQTKSAGSTVSYYYTPIAIRVQGSLAGQDTVLVIYDQNGQLSRAGDGIGAAVSGTIISFNLGFNPVTVTFDPFAQTLANG